MKSTWNDGIGSRGRQPKACLVTADGNVHSFTGGSISGVCRSDITGYTKNGKWSNSDYAILHADTTVFVSWSQNWGTGQSWPQLSWKAGWAWLAEKASALTEEGFEKFIRACYPTTAKRWDEQKASESEFGGEVPTAEMLARVESNKAEIAKLHAEADEQAKTASTLRDTIASLESAKVWRDQAAQRLAEAEVQAAELAGLEVNQLQLEAQELEKKAENLRRGLASKQEAKARKDRAAQLGNGFASALAGLKL